MSNFLQSYNFIKKKQGNKKDKQPDKIRVRCQRFYSSFHHIIFTNNCYSFGENNSIWKYGSFPPHKRYSVDQLPPPLVIVVDATWGTKGRHGHVRVSQPGDDSDNIFLTFNSTSISVEYNQIFYLKYTIF